MIENLLHENVVLSEDQAHAVRKMGITLSDRKIAVLTYLGADAWDGTEVRVLVRINMGQKFLGPDAVREVFGEKTILLFDCASEHGIEYRAIGTVLLTESIRYPRGVLRMKAKELAEAFVEIMASFRILN